MYKTLFLLGLLAMYSCQNTPKLDNSPEAVAKAWQTYLDKSDFESAKNLSSPEAAKFVAFLEKLENDVVEMDSNSVKTVLDNMKCKKNGDMAVCIYTDEFGREDKFDLIKTNGKWLVHLLLEEELNLDLDELLEDTEELLEDAFEEGDREI